MPRELESKEDGWWWKAAGSTEPVKSLQASLYFEAISPSFWILQHFEWARPDLGCAPLIPAIAFRASVLTSARQRAHFNKALPLPPTTVWWPPRKQVLRFTFLSVPNRMSCEAFTPQRLIGDEPAFCVALNDSLWGQPFKSYPTS